MNAAYAAEAMHTARHVLRSPKGYMLIFIGAIVAIGSVATGLSVTMPGVAAAAVTAVAIDALLRAAWRRAPEFPSGALLTGLVIALVLDPYAPAYVLAAAAAIGVTSKHLIRSGTTNVFNPAIVGLVAVHLMFGQGESWWGGLSAYGPSGMVLILLPGIWIVDHVNKLPLVLAFLGTYFSLFTVTAFGPDPVRVAEVFGASDVHMAVFFACYILDDPPTSPTRYFDQIWYGALVAGIGYLLFMTTGIVYFLPAALLVGNVANHARRQWKGASPFRLRRTVAN